MKMKNTLLTSVCACVLAITTFVPLAQADDTAIAISRAGNAVVNAVNKQGIFDWIGGSVGYVNKKLTLNLTAFKGLAETKNALTYVQGSLNRKVKNTTLNLGLGYRRLLNANSVPIMVGINTFVDSRDSLSFNINKGYVRSSVGLELKTAGFDISANIYRPLTKGIVKDHKVLKGWDITAKGQLPIKKDIALGVSIYRFDGVHDGEKDIIKQGKKGIAEYTPNQIITLRGTYDKPNKGQASTNINLNFKFAFGKSFAEQWKPIKTSGNNAVWHKRFNKIERDYTVKIVKVKTNPTPPIGGVVRSKTSASGTTFTPTWNNPTSVTYEGKTYTTTSSDTNTKLSYTFAVIASDVGGVSVGETTNFNTTTGQIKGTKNAGTITIRITRAKVGDLPLGNKRCKYYHYRISTQY